MLHARLRLTTSSPHTCAVLTGFHLLAQQGALTCTLEDCRIPASPLAGEALLEADCGGLCLVFDLMDGYFYNRPEAVFSLFERADVIFKRSYSKPQNSLLPASVRAKLRPLGLNYFVTYPGCPLTPPRRNPLARWQDRRQNTSCTVPVFEAALPHLTKHPQVLFLTRLWDPSEPALQAHPELQAQWEAVSRSRIALLRALREAFPGQFIGGVSQSSYAEALSPDLILPARATSKRQYLAQVRRSAVCIASTGLHQSVGWKLAEYLAAGRAVVSEPLCCQLPGPFASGQNYLPYTTPEECVAQAKQLLTHPDALLAMAQRNRRYYQEYVRPDAQLAHALAQLPALGFALSTKGGPA